MNKFERILSGVIGALTLIIFFIGVAVFAFDPVGDGKVIARSHPVHTITYAELTGASFVVLLLAGVALICMATAKLLPSSFSFVMVVIASWEIIIEPILRIFAGIPELLGFWTADVFIILILSSPALLYYWRVKKTDCVTTSC